MCKTIRSETGPFSNLMDEHIISLSELVTRLETDFINGLTEAKAAELLARDGHNKFKEYTTPLWLKLCKHLFGGFALVYWFGGILCLLLYSVSVSTHLNVDVPNIYLLLGVAIIVSVTSMGCFSYLQETKRKLVNDSLLKRIPWLVIVVRNGQKVTVRVDELVVGDLVNIKAGDCIPADIRLVTDEAFSVDNSILTGENMSQRRTAETFCDLDSVSSQLESRNIIFMNTTAVEGTCTGIVIRTGNRTIMGQCVTNSVYNHTIHQYPIEHEMFRFLAKCFVSSLTVGSLLFLVFIMFGHCFVTAAVLFVCVFVAGVPQVLLAAFSVCLTGATQRIAHKCCLVKNTCTVTQLAGTTTICADKTGTLTQNRLTVARLWYDARLFKSDTSEHQVAASVDETPGLLALARAAMLNSRAEFKNNSENMRRGVLQRETTGDAVDAALLKYAEMRFGNVKRFRAANTCVAAVPFNGRNKFQLSIHVTNDGDPRYLMVIRGAPERLIAYCTSIYIKGCDTQMSTQWQEQFQNVYDMLGNMGERVVCLCDKRLDVSEYPRGYSFDEYIDETQVNGLRFVGLVSLIDPPRAAVPNAIAQYRRAGIKVVMMTGDHPLTAKTIARRIGILDETNESEKNDSRSIIVHGSELMHMSDTELCAVLQRHDELVFAKVSPQQKARIVTECHGIVTVMGDSVNDLAAMRLADVTVCMGVTGSDVCRHVADIVLVNDDVTSVVTCVEEGRLVVDNMRKCVSYMLTSKIPTMFTLLLYITIGIPLPLNAATILSIELITNVLPAASFAYEKPELDIMNHSPLYYKPGKLLTSWRLVGASCGQIGVIQATAGLFAYLVVLAENGFWPTSLISIRQKWDSNFLNDLEDSYGQEWTYEQRKKLEHTGQVAFFVAIVIVQSINLLAHKTRRTSLLQQTSNRLMNLSLLCVTSFTALFCCVSSLDNGNTMKLKWYLLSVPFALLIVIYNETRKWAIRRFPSSFVEKQTHY